MFRSAKSKNYNILLKFTTQWTHYLDLIVVVVGLVVGPSSSKALLCVAYLWCTGAGSMLEIQLRH